MHKELRSTNKIGVSTKKQKIQKEPNKFGAEEYNMCIEKFTGGVNQQLDQTEESVNLNTGHLKSTIEWINETSTWLFENIYKNINL